MTEAEFNQTAVRDETASTITHDLRPFGAEQQGAVALFLGKQVFNHSIGALNTSKSVTLQVDDTYQSTAQLDGFIEKLTAAGLHISIDKQ
jgi:hypothetical protein